MSAHIPAESFDLRASTRRGTLSVVMWVFGLSTTVLLIAMWGRAVTIDQNTFAESAGAIVNADVAQDRVVAWIEDAMVQSETIGSQGAKAVIENVRSTPQMHTAIQNLTSAFVGALFAEEEADAVVDVRSAMAPVVPVIADELAKRDVPISESAITSVLAAGDLDLGAGDTTGVVAVVREARNLVNTAAVIALMVMMLAGASAVSLSDDNYAMVKTLGTRVLVSALSFSVIFRLGGWILDPQRGRSPIATGTGILLGSNGHVFLITALLAAAVTAIGGWVVRSRRLRALTPVRSDLADDDTRELVSA